MHISIETFLESEAAAAGLGFPMVLRDEYGRLNLYEAESIIGDDALFIEAFNDNIDALARMGACVALFLSDDGERPLKRQIRAFKRFNGEGVNGETV